MADCIHCNGPIIGKSIRVIRSAPAFIHDECYRQLCNSFFKLAVQQMKEVENGNVH